MSGASPGRRRGKRKAMPESTAKRKRRQVRSDARARQARCRWLCGALIALVGLLCACPTFGGGPAVGMRLRLIGRITDPPIREASALVRSRKHPGVFWTLNDSGNLPVLYALDRTGKLLGQYWIKGAVNLDWEAMAADPEGHLYIGDVGENIGGGVFAAQQIYRVKEPDPLGATSQPVCSQANREIVPDAVFRYEFAAKSVDVEALFFHAGSLYLISKVRKEPTRLYRLDLSRPGKSTELIEVCKLPVLRDITGADLSPDGRRLAVCSFRYVAIFELASGEPLSRLSEAMPTLVTFRYKPIQGCCWDGPDLLLISEARRIYALKTRGHRDGKSAAGPSESR